MPFWETLIAKLQTAELKSLDLIEHPMKEEGRTKENARFINNGLSLDNILLGILVAFFVLFVFRLYR